MELEERVEQLEKQMEVLQIEIRRTLVDIRQGLPEHPPAPSRWQRKAWILSLLNVLIATALFTNIYYYVPGSAPFEMNPILAEWFRSLWLVMAFIWLILQMYPLALLFEQEDQQWKGVLWRNAAAFAHVRPTTLVLLTIMLLLVGIVNTLVPWTWLIIAAVLLFVLAGIGLRYAMDFFRLQGQAHGKS